MEKIWHPYTAWEDYRAGMWRSVSGKERISFLKKAIDFTGDHELYGSFMKKVITDWPIGCEHHLSGDQGNKKAAACCLAINCPEDITRHAWSYLTKQQQDDANAQAQKYIDEWYATKN